MHTLAHLQRHATHTILQVAPGRVAEIHDLDVPNTRLEDGVDSTISVEIDEIALDKLFECLRVERLLRCCGSRRAVQHALEVLQPAV